MPSFLCHRIDSLHSALLVIVIALLLISGCQNGAALVDPSDPPPSQLADNHQPALSSGSTTQQATATDDPLVLWVPPFFTINTTDRADAVLAAALAEFAPTPTGSSVTLVPKAERGPAGLLAYLLTTQQAAPILLPDIVLLNSFDLVRAAGAGIVPPLSAEESAPFGGISPAILTSAQIDNQLYGLPFVANLEHLVYQKERLAAPPATWGELLAQDKRLLFAGGTVDDYSLSFAWTLYLVGGGGLDGEGNLTSPQVMERVFDFLAAGKQAGLIPEAALTLSSPQAVWTFFVNGDAEMAVVPARLYHNQQAEADSIRFAPLPTLDGEPRTVVTSWSFAVVTQEPARRQRALALLQQLFAPHIQGEWSSSARQVPTQSDAFAYWDASDPYTLFLQELLRNSVAAPNLRAFNELNQSLQQGQRALLTGELSPQQVLEMLPFRP